MKPMCTRIVAAVFATLLVAPVLAQTAVGPAVTPHLELTLDTAVVHREWAGSPFMRLIGPYGKPSLTIKADGTIDLREGATISFDTPVYTRRGEFLAYIPVRIGDRVVLIPAFDLPAEEVRR